MIYDIFISGDGVTGQFHSDYDDLDLALAHYAALVVSGFYGRVTLYRFDDVLKTWSKS